MWTCLVSWKASRPSRPSSRPRPDCLKPPKGPALLCLLVGALLGAGQAGAATFMVENLKDSGPGSLRRAVADANAGTSMDAIYFAPELDGTIRLTSGALEISSIIYMPGREGLTISGEGRDRIFVIRPKGDLYIEGLTLTRGSSSAGGGGILNEGRLSLNWSTLKASTVIGADGKTGHNGDPGGPGGNAAGGEVTSQSPCSNGNRGAGRGGGVMTRGAKAKTFMLDSTLADNGGPTLTRAIRLFSPAVDKGNATTYVDQRGRPKPILIPGIPAAPGGARRRHRRLRGAAARRRARRPSPARLRQRARR